jgi:hypothetical protein
MAVNPDNVLAVAPASANGVTVVSASGLMLPGGSVVEVLGNAADVSSQLGEDFVRLSSNGFHVNRRMVLLVEAGRDDKDRTIVGVVVVVVLGAPQPFVVQTSVGEVAQALELGGGRQDQLSRLVVMQ